jgi:pilus assembly protein CpaE
MRLTFLPRDQQNASPPAASLRREPASGGLRVGYEPSVFEGHGADGLARQFPVVRFEPLGPATARHGHDVLILSVDANDRSQVDQTIARLHELAGRTSTIVVLRGATLDKTRKLLRAGAADVLPAPASEPSLAVALERLLARLEPEDAGHGGQVVALLKAGGGAGATSVGLQTATILAEAGLKVCFADLDVQFGSAAVYLDLPEAASVEEVLAAGRALQELPFATSLAAHRTGVRILAAPRTVMALEALTPALVDGLIAGLKREFDVVVVDLPGDWTAWTNQVLQQADRLILVTRLSVPHALLTRRQLQTLALQQLDGKPITLVCNQVAPDMLGGLSIGAVQRAVGRDFDVVLPEDRRLMSDAINQGLAVADVRRGSKLEKALRDLAAVVRPARADTRATRR